MSTPPERGLGAAHAWAPYFFMIMTALIFAGNHVIGRVIREDIPPMGLVFWRTVVAFIIVTPFVYRPFRAQLPILLRHWRLLFLLGITNSVGGQALLLVALHTTTAVNTGLLNATEAVLTFLIAWLLLGDRITSRQGIGLVIAIVGVMAIIARGDFNVLLNLEFVVGDLWVQVAFANWAMYNVLVKRAPPELNPFVLLQAISITGIIAVLPFFVGEMLLFDRYVQVNAITLATMVYFGVFSSIIAIVFLNAGIKRLGPGPAGAFLYLVPVLTAVLAVVTLGETFRLYHLFGAVFVFYGVYLTSGRRAAH